MKNNIVLSSLGYPTTIHDYMCKRIRFKKKKKKEKQKQNYRISKQKIKIMGTSDL